MNCSQCGNELRENSTFCDQCGAAAQASENKQTNMMAILGLIVAGISLLLNFWGIVGIAAVILSSLGLLQINNNEGKGKNLAITGIAIGAFSIIYGVIGLISLI